MAYTILRLFLLVLLSLLISDSASYATGGAWNKTKRGYYIKVGLESTLADKEFDIYANRREIVGDSVNFRRNSFSSTDFSLYVEYGLVDWFTATLSTQYKVVERTGEYVVTRRDSTIENDGPGDIWVGARLRLLPKESTIVGAFTIGIKLPTGATSGDIALGTGAADYEGALAFGTGWSLADDLNGYAQISAGYRLRGRGSKEVNYLAELGVSPIKDLTLHGILEGVRSQADFGQDISPDNPGLVAPLVSDQSFMRWRAGLIYALDTDIEFNIGYTAVISGRNTLALAGPAIGLAFKQ